MMRQFFNQGKEGAREASRIVGGEEAHYSDCQADVLPGGVTVGPRDGRQLATPGSLRTTVHVPEDVDVQARRQVPDAAA